MKKITLTPVFKDERGSIDTIFAGIPWKEINKFTSEKDAVRGNHYHKKTQELIFILYGKVEVNVRNVKTKETETLVIGKDEGVIIEPYDLHTITILEKTVWIGCL